MAERWKEKKLIKDEKEFLEQIILKHAKSEEIIDSPDATDEEKAANRQRILNAKTTRWRIIFSQWPRNPEGKRITPKNLSGSSAESINAHPWGATLFDFYSVKPLPESTNLAFSSGSTLAAWMKANGEDYAKNLLEFTENEEDPYLIHPYEITGLIQDTDQSVDDKKSWIRVVEKEKGKSKKMRVQREHWQVPQPVRFSTILFLCIY
jgi:hypothetical protein